jgi:acyl dehydratase
MNPADAPSAPLMQVGEEFSCRLLYSREQIAGFARMTGDDNPLHRDLAAARRSEFGEIIASGQQTASHMMGLVASHFSRNVDGLEREMLCLNFNFAFRHPVPASQDIIIHWRVTEVEPNRRHGGLIGHLDGEARVGGRACVISRGTVLVTPRTTARL